MYRDWRRFVILWLLVVSVHDLRASHACQRLGNYTAQVSLGGNVTTQNGIEVLCSSTASVCDFEVGNYRMVATCNPPLLNYLYYPIGKHPRTVKLMQYVSQLTNDETLQNQTLQAFRDTIADDLATAKEQQAAIKGFGGRRLLSLGLDMGIGAAVGLPVGAGAAVAIGSSLGIALGPIGVIAGAGIGALVGAGVGALVSLFTEPSNSDLQSEIGSLTDKVTDGFKQVDQFEATTTTMFTVTQAWEAKQTLSDQIQNQENTVFAARILANANAITNLAGTVETVANSVALLHNDTYEKFDETLAYINSIRDALESQQETYESNVLQQFQMIQNAIGNLSASDTSTFQTLTGLIQSENEITSELAASVTRFIRGDILLQGLSAGFFSQYASIPAGMKAFVHGAMIFPHPLSENPQLRRIQYETLKINFVEIVGGNTIIVATTFNFYFETNAGIYFNSQSLSATKLVKLMSLGNCSRPVVFDSLGHVVPESPPFNNATNLCFIYAEVSSQQCTASSASFNWQTAEATTPQAQTGTLFPQYCQSSVTTTDFVIRTFADLQSYYANNMCAVHLADPQTSYQFISVLTKRIGYVPQSISTCNDLNLADGFSATRDLFTIIFADLLAVFGAFENTALNVAILINGRPPLIGVNNVFQPFAGTPTNLDSSNNAIPGGASETLWALQGNFLAVSNDVIDLINIQIDAVNPISQTIDIVTTPLDPFFSPQYEVPEAQGTIQVTSQLTFPAEGAFLGDIATEAYLYDVPESLLNFDAPLAARAATFGYLIDPFPEDTVYWELIDWLAFNGNDFAPQKGALNPLSLSYTKAFDEEGYPYCLHPNGVAFNQTAIINTLQFNYTGYVDPDSFICTFLKLYKVKRILLGTDSFGNEQFGLTAEPRVWTARAQFFVYDGVIIQDLGGVGCTQTTLNANDGPLGLRMTLINTGTVTLRQRIVTSQPLGFNASSICATSTIVDVAVSVPGYVDIKDCPSLIIDVQKLVAETEFGETYQSCKNYTPADINQAKQNNPGPDPNIPVIVNAGLGQVGSALSDLGSASTGITLDVLGALAQIFSAGEDLTNKISAAKSASQNLQVAVNFTTPITSFNDTIGPIIAGVVAAAQSSLAFATNNSQTDVTVNEQLQLLFQAQDNITAQQVILVNQSATLLQKLHDIGNLSALIAQLEALQAREAAITASEGSLGFPSSFGSLFGDLTGGGSLFSGIVSWVEIIGLVAGIIGAIYCFYKCGCCNCSNNNKSSSSGFQRRPHRTTEPEYTPVRQSATDEAEERRAFQPPSSSSPVDFYSRDD